jgi:hypothetical protein
VKDSPERYTLITQSVENSNPPRSVVLRLPVDRVLVYVPRLALADAMGSYWGDLIDKQKNDTYGNETWVSEHEKGIDSRPDKTSDPSDVDWLPDNIKNLTDLTITLQTEQISSVRYSPGPEKQTLVPVTVNFADFNLPVPASAWHGIDWRSEYKPWRWSVQPGSAENPYRPTLAILASHLRKVHTTFDCQNFYYMVDPPSAFETVEGVATETVNFPAIGSIVLTPRQSPTPAVPIMTAAPRLPPGQDVLEMAIPPDAVFATVSAAGSVVTAYQNDNSWVIGGFRVGPNAAQQMVIDGTALEMGPEGNLLVGGMTVLPSMQTGTPVQGGKLDSSPRSGGGQTGTNNQAGFGGELNGKFPTGNESESDFGSPESWPGAPPKSSSSGVRKSSASKSDILAAHLIMLWIVVVGFPINLL